MIWTTWRQHRAELLTLGVALALLAAALILTGIQMSSAYSSLGVATCASNRVTTVNCGQIVGTFRDEFGWMESAVGWLNFIPALVAMLVGAPLVARELEHRTHLLAWTQSVTRRRWLSAKLVAVIGGGALVAAILTALFTWWRFPLDQLQGRMSPSGYDFEGIVLFAYMMFALALAIAAGTLLRRTIPAMVMTLVGFLAVRLPIEFWVRPYLFEAPVTLRSDPVTGASPTHADWQVAFGFADSAGRPLTDTQVFGACAGQNSVESKLNVLQCIHTHGWVFTYVYQPADRFWRFQITEAIIYLALTIALLGLTMWWTQRRIR